MIVAGFIMSGCIKSSVSQPTPPRSYVSILHLAPTGPSLDVYFNDTKVSTNAFTPGAVSSAYNAIEKGNFIIKLKKAGADSLVATVPLTQYDSLHFYTIFIFNQQTDGPVHAVRIEDNFSNLTSGRSFYRFFHGSPNVNAIDLFLDNVKIASGRTAADNATQESLNIFGETPTGIHNFQVKLAGTDSVIASLVNTELIPGSAYTIYLKGLGGGSGHSALSLDLLRAVN